MASQTGQASIEWTGLVLLVGLALAAVVAFAPVIDGRAYGGALTHAIVCAVRGRCDDGAIRLSAAYPPADAELLRRFAPNIVYEPGERSLPVDFRVCRSRDCADAPDDRDLDAHSSSAGGVRAAAFTHVAHRDGETFLQYWFYYPDSDSHFPGSHELYDAIPFSDRAAAAVTGKRRYPGFHRDDWEGYQVRVDDEGNARVRATSHNGYQACKETQCHNRWTAWTGWTRVSEGSHAGHIPLETEWVSDGPRRRRRGPASRHVAGYRTLLPGRDLHERTTTAAGLELIPIETLPAEVREGSRFDSITPPWEKEVFDDPASSSTG
jgi:hypothetical protein